MDAPRETPLELSVRMLRALDVALKGTQDSLRGALTGVQALQPGEKLTPRQSVELLAALTQGLATLDEMRRLIMAQADDFTELAQAIAKAANDETQ